MSEFRRRLLTAMNKAEPPITKDYLTIVALEDGLTAKLSINACEYCVDGDGNWKSLPADTETEPINAGQTLSFRANLAPTSNGIGTFTVNKYYNLKGNCMSLLYGNDARERLYLCKSYAFYNLFKGNDKLINVSKLFLPATTISMYCYYGMFEGCVSLQTVPNLPTAGNVPGYCYRGMFMNCKSMVSSPILQGKTIGYGCYAQMFNGCENLNTIIMLATDISAGYCLNNWVNGVSEFGTFVKSKDATWDVVGVSGVPRGWMVITE